MNRALCPDAAVGEGFTGESENPSPDRMIF